MTHWFSGTDGYAGKTLHNSKQCSELSEPYRPLADSTVKQIEDADRCAECHADVSDNMQSRDKEQLIQEGVCPWCDRDGFQSVGRHASSAHPDEWEEYSA